MIYSNLHTHTDFCDGKAPAEDYVKKAIELGFHTIGFSSHSHTEIPNDVCLSADETSYHNEIIRLKDKYKNDIFVAHGIEQDFMSNPYTYDYDFVIGSLHYLFHNDKYISVDYSKERFTYIIKNEYLGDVMAFIKDYYSSEAKIAEITKCNIVGHLDLIRKFNDGNAFFDENDKQYQKYALDAVDEILENCNLFEINTGATARGATKTPYPSSFILKYICQKGGRVILGSDSHSPDTLGAYFDEAIIIAKQNGFKSIVQYTKDGFTDVEI